MRPVLPVPLLRGGDGDVGQLSLQLDDVPHLARDIRLEYRTVQYSAVDNTVQYSTLHVAVQYSAVPG